MQIEGLVTIVPKSGTYVFTPTVEDITELCDYRIGLEQHAVTLTPRDSIGKAAAELQKQLDAMEGAIAASDMQAYGRADTEFHLAFFRHCGNRYLRNAYHLILGRVASLRTHLAINAPGEPDRSMADHRQMLALLAQGKKAEIAALLGKHIAHTRNNYLEVFQVNDPVGRARGRAIRLRRRLAILA